MKWLLIVPFIGGAGICVASFWCASYAFNNQWATFLATAMVGIVVTAFLGWLAHESDQPGAWAVVLVALCGFFLMCVLIVLSRGTAIGL